MATETADRLQINFVWIFGLICFLLKGINPYTAHFGYKCEETVLYDALLASEDKQFSR